MAESAIEWTDATWNPVIGCDRVSPGCANCYAMELAPRLRAMQQTRGGGVWAEQEDGGKSSGPAFAVRMLPERLGDPLRWRKPRMVFVNSMSDLFHEQVTDAFISQVWGAMMRAPHHTFQVLTKRPERARDLLTAHRWATPGGHPLPNVWLGVSIENRRYVHRADVLRDTPAAVRFISAEPLLGPLIPEVREHVARGVGYGVAFRSWRDGLNAYENPGLYLERIDWLIAGGESGPRYRPMKAEWVRDLRDECEFAGTAFFLKQWGGPKPGGSALLDGREYRAYPTGTSTPEGA